MSHRHVTTALQRATTQDLLRAVGVENRPLLAKLLRRPVTLITRGVVREAAEFESCVSVEGLCAASKQYLSRLGATLNLHAANEIPSDGPLLIVANHPGLSDTLALFSAIRREDLLIIADANPFLEALASVRKQLILLPDGHAQKGFSLRTAVRHLRQDGALLTFPSGQIEPDPGLYPEEAVTSLKNWSESLTVLTRAVPGVRVVPLLVSGVIHPDVQKHWLTRIRRDRRGHDQVAVYLQLLLKRFQGVAVRVHVGRTIEPNDSLLADVRMEMTRLIRTSTGECRQQVKVMNVEQEVAVRELTPPKLQPPA
ncbi:1-acyl-sn-glycerol-3-phosphate acyltransferase [bacterium]|nr:1-acyl-sn-glycerol-3-phosphate acyltransferase [bacterium]